MAGGRWAVVAAVAAAVAASTVTWWLMSQSFDPLGDYPPQDVIADERHGVPTVTAADDVHVVGIKCNESDAPVQVAGHAAWQSVDPPGTVITVGEGTAIREPGCERFEFVNPVPPDVLARTRELGGRVLWRITGTETPIRGDGIRGVPRTWTTETLAVEVDR